MIYLIFVFCQISIPGVNDAIVSTLGLDRDLEILLIVVRLMEVL